MADVTKYQPINGGNLVSDVKSLFSILKTRRTMAFAYGFMFAFVVFTAFLAFNPSTTTTFSPSFSSIFGGGNSVTDNSSDGASGSRYSSFFSYFFPNGSLEQSNRVVPPPAPEANLSRSSNATVQPPVVDTEPPRVKNRTEVNGDQTKRTVVPENPPAGNQTLGLPVSPPTATQPTDAAKNDAQSTQVSDVPNSNQTKSLPAKAPPVVDEQVKSSGLKSIPSQNSSSKTEEKQVAEGSSPANYTAPLSKKQKGEMSPDSGESAKHNDLESLKNCDFFDGEWVPDDSYPLYKPGSCGLIDEQFNCHLNGRPDKNHQKLKWKPKGCDLPRYEPKFSVSSVDS